VVVLMSSSTRSGDAHAVALTESAAAAPQRAIQVACLCITPRVVIIVRERPTPDKSSLEADSSPSVDPRSVASGSIVGARDTLAKTQGPKRTRSEGILARRLTVARFARALARARLCRLC